MTPEKLLAKLLADFENRSVLDDIAGLSGDTIDRIISITAMEHKASRCIPCAQGFFKGHYQEWLTNQGIVLLNDPEEYLKQLVLFTKEHIEIWFNEPCSKGEK